MIASFRLPVSLRCKLEYTKQVYKTSDLPVMLGGPGMIIAVGDVVSLTLKQLGIVPKVFIVDYKTQRGGESQVFKAELGGWTAVERRVTNPAGEITISAYHQVFDAIKSDDVSTRVLVDGEEDLLAIPCIMCAPVGAKLVYGIPNKGVAVLTVTNKLRKTVVALFEQFEVIRCD